MWNRKESRKILIFSSDDASSVISCRQAPISVSLGSVSRRKVQKRTFLLNLIVLVAASQLFKSGVESSYWHLWLVEVDEILVLILALVVFVKLE